jgi:hypothetical protein
MQRRGGRTGQDPRLNDHPARNLDSLPLATEELIEE